MSRFKAGQSIVLDILDISDYNCYKLGNEDISWWATCTTMDKVAEPLTDYTMPLINKIERQRNSITSLLNQNADLKRESAELKKDLEYYQTGTDLCDIESARAAGEEAAWELAGKLLDMDYTDFKKIFGITSIKNIINQGYTEVSAKVAEWERKKEEICVGDVVKVHEGNENDICVICISSDKKYYNAIDKYGALYPMLTRETISKTGRHIDVDAWLAQIGDDRNG